MIRPRTFTATAEAHPGRVFHGKVQRISPTIQPSSGQFRITAKIETPPESESAPLLPGMLMRMQIVTERHPDALVVPKRALRREGETRFVLALEEAEDDGTASVRKVIVEESFSDEDDVEVVPSKAGALEVGHRIVEVGSRDLEENDIVQIEMEQIEADQIEKLRYDMFYVKHHSVLFDVRILVETVRVVFAKNMGR